MNIKLHNIFSISQNNENCFNFIFNNKKTFKLILLVINVNLQQLCFNFNKAHKSIYLYIMVLYCDQELPSLFFIGEGRIKGTCTEG